MNGSQRDDCEPLVEGVEEIPGKTFLFPEATGELRSSLSIASKNRFVFFLPLEMMATVAPSNEVRRGAGLNSLAPASCVGSRNSILTVHWLPF